MRYWLLLAGLLAVQPASAYQLQTLAVARDGGQYTLTVQAELQAPPGKVFLLLSNLAQLGRINPAVTRVSLQSQPDGALRVESEAKVCFASFCRQILHAQRVELLPGVEGGQILSRTEPMPGSSFASGHARVMVSGQGGGTLFTLISHSEPSFWLPPFIGPWAIEKRMKEDALASLANLERLARE